jgi:hypothetical protein
MAIVEKTPSWDGTMRPDEQEKALARAKPMLISKTPKKHRSAVEADLALIVETWKEAKQH